MMNNTLLITCMVVGSAFPAEAVTGASDTYIIDAFLSRMYPADEPGAAVLAMKNGTVVYRQACGMADLELTVPLRPESVFRLGSVTKTFTATAIMLLVDEEKLSLNDDITAYLPEYPTQGRRITIEHLLAHTSGIISDRDMPQKLAHIRDDLTVAELLDLFQHEPMRSEPGEEHVYNNHGYQILGAVIERVSGESYADFVEERIFRTARMSDSYYGTHRRIIPNRASGYTFAAGYRNADFVNSSYFYSDGGLLSTIDDMASFLSALESGELVSKESLSRMTRPFKLNSGQDCGYGYGWSVARLRNRRLLSHGGGMPGYTCGVWWLPDDHIYVVVLTNRDGREPHPSYVGKWIAASLLGRPYKERKAIELQPSVLDRYAGVYTSSDGIPTTVTREGTGLLIRTEGKTAPRAQAHAETEFFCKYRFSTVSFYKNRQGDFDRMVIHTSDGNRVAMKTDERIVMHEVVALDPATYADYTGKYDFPAAGRQLHVTRTGDRFFAQATGGRLLEVFPKSKDVFFLKVMDAQITFIRDRQGNTTGLVWDEEGQRFEGTKIE